MIFNVTDAWRIVSSEQSWMVQKYRGVYKSGKKIGAVKYESIAYTTTLDAAVGILADRMIRELETHGTMEAIAGVRRVVDVIDEAFAGFSVRITIDTGAKTHGR